MKHADNEQLSAFLDGEDESVRAHVEACESCRRALEDLRTMRDGLRALPPPEAPDDWMALSRKLAEEKPRRRWWRLAWAPSLALAGAMVLTVYIRQKGGVSDDALIAEAEAEFRGAEAQYQRAVERLRVVTARAKENWPAARNREFDGALAALEEATEKCRRVARERPADAEAEALLFTAYRNQIRFYQEQLLK